MKSNKKLIDEGRNEKQEKPCHVPEKQNYKLF